MEVMEFEAKITSEISLNKNDKNHFNKSNGYLVRLVGAYVGFNENKTNSLIFLKNIWQGKNNPVIGEIVILSDIRNMGKNKQGRDKFRAFCAKPKPIL